VHNRPHIFDLDRESLQAIVDSIGERRHVTDQVLQWVYRHGVLDVESMTNISAVTRKSLSSSIQFKHGTVIEDQLASDGTRKVLVDWDAAPGNLPVLQEQKAGTRRSEAVMIPTDSRRTACVSSQVGCPVGCTFCASGIGGLDGNLTRGQIVEQIHHLRSGEPGGRITNVVFMGMGEPLANMTAVMEAIRTMNADWGFGIGARRITVSTVGLPTAIRRFVEFEIPVTLALSLHAPNDQLRRELIPWAEYSTIDELLDAASEWFHSTGREITLEYILLGEVNDRPEHARELADLASQMRANVNLIRYNEVEGMPHSRPRDEDVRQFQRILRADGVNTHIRASRGRDISAACGQLRHESRERSDQP